MAMNYVGSISIMDRGDAPAQAVMDRNARSLAQRVADETRDELEKVLSRVENIYGSFEMSGEYGYDTNMEYVNDIGELEELIRDQVKKRKYQQQVTIFIVGFQDVSGQKLRLLQQVNEFFMENSKSYEEEDWFPGTPDIDLEDVADKIDDSLKTANDLTKRLGELNKEIVDCLAAYAEKKATNKQVNLQGGEVKGRKKLEKALQSTRDEVANLSEKLLSIQTEIEEKEEKMQALFKQLEVKNLELQRFKTAAEVAKKNVQDSERLQAEIAARDETIKELRQKVNHLEIEVTSSNHTEEVSQSKLASVAEENQHRITKLTQEVEDRKIAIDEAKRDLQKVHESQVNALQETHRTEIDDLKKQHADEVKQLVEELERTQHELIAAQHRAAQLQSEKGDRESTDTTRIFDLDPSEPPSQDTTRQSTREGSRQSEKSKGKTKSKSKTGETRSKASRQGSVASKKSGKSPSRGSKSESKPGSRASIKADDHKDDVDDEIVDITQYTPADAKEYAEAAVQDEGGNPSTASVEKTVAKGRRSKTGLAPVRETDAAEYDNAFDLSDDASWAAVPSDQVSGRFTQYRKLCQRRVAELEEQLQLTQAKTQRKVSTLKAQFQEHKAKWEAERKLLFEQVSQAHKLQTEAEKEADAAMTQLEDFINEQEKLELDEESKRQGILGKTDTVAMEAKATAAKKQGESTTDGAMAAQPARSEDTEHDLRTLLQQTDDAKVQELNSRMTTSGAMSAPPAVEDDEVEPADKTSETAVTPTEVGPIEPDVAAEASPASHDDGPEPEPQDLENIKSQKSFSSAGSRKSAVTTPSVKSTRSKKSVQARSDHTDPDQTSLELPKSGPVSRASQTSSGKTSKRLTPSTDLRRETSSISATSGLRSSLEVPQSPGKVDVTAEEDIRASSARSRASLRNQFRQKLVETKKVVDERRTKSPGMVLPTPRSMEEDTLHLDDEDDVTLPDDLKEEYRHKTLDIGTSPPPGMKRDDTLVSITDARQTPSLWDHPVVQDFLQVYEGVVQFKDQLGKILMDKELMSASQILSDLDVLRLDKSVKIQPQINNMAHNIYFMLEEIGNLLNNILVYDRDPPVSSLNISRDPTKGTLTHEETMDSVQHAFPSTRGSQRSQSSDQKTSSSVRELQEQYERLNEQFEEESKKHEEQLRHNTVVMMEMQDTINDLQRELSTLGKTAKRSRSATPVLQQRLQQIPSPETSVMFTRLDSERNAKIMKKAVLDDRLGPERYKDAVGQMNQYVSLPAQRLAHLARKYIHHCRMKAIEENVKKSESLNENVFEVLDKMEALQNERARKWAEHMDDMGAERLKLASILMETLDSIEQESGLFLIKPMYSFRGREMKQKYVGKLSRPGRPLRASPIRETASSMAPAPTPSSHIRPLDGSRAYHKISSASTTSHPEPLRPLEGDPGGVAGASMSWVGQAPRQTWSFSSSHAKHVPADPLSLYNTPRILELDINRMLIGQNNISSRLPQPMTEDRLVNASQNNLRSYVTVNRPVATPTTTTNSSRPRSASGTHRDSVPPTTPQHPSSAGMKKVRLSDTDMEIPRSLRHPRSPPLPPIGGTEPPQSPSGSSVRQTPPIREADTPGDDKTLTRESSHLTSATISED
ncbi:myosin-9-like isoform X4 [Haliotis rufescens]|uniref:myosin-9-like isoform X4 n=1 Tax=Haliotis rufescens TaxID=6454 RepID=UPI00201EAFF9|nr:myosin-9-like isoform X4 [Haliotis rufescens]